MTIVSLLHESVYATYRSTPFAGHGVLFVKYASILLQALTIQLDEAFLYAVLDLTKLQGVDWEAESEK